MEYKYLTIETATDFFSEYYRGEHHFPSKIQEAGYGFSMNDRHGSMATFDYNNLTRLVLMAHRDCIRVDLQPTRNGIMKIIIHQRQGRDGSIFDRHPDIYQAIEAFNKK